VFCEILGYFFTNSSGHPAFAEIEEMVTAADIDGDGKISFQARP
jgi:hypothetical protein